MIEKISEIEMLTSRAHKAEENEKDKENKKKELDQLKIANNMLEIKVEDQDF